MMVDAPQFVPDKSGPEKTTGTKRTKKPETKKAKLLNFLKTIPQ